MDMNKDQAPVPVPEGYALVPVQPVHGKMPVGQDWYSPVPAFDPQSDLERWWSLIMRWPRRLAVGFLYLTWSWQRSATAAAIVGVAIFLIRAYQESN